VGLPLFILFGYFYIVHRRAFLDKATDAVFMHKLYARP
jgi:hypothetical protein